jgi:hypothetical protein
MTVANIIVIVKTAIFLKITIMTRGCESKQAHSRCQNHQQNRIIFGNDYTCKGVKSND